MSIQSMGPDQLRERVASGQEIPLIDVRTPLEFREIHATCARNLPLDKLTPSEIANLRNEFNDTLYVICKSGGRSKQACEKMMAAGLSNVVSIEGGTVAWEQAGLPVVRGRKAMSLERQVRIAAGSIVVIGLVLSQLLHPYFFWLSGFVGAGLIFAGITDTCGMGLLLARMPWNQVRS